MYIPALVNATEDNKTGYNVRAVLGIHNDGKREFLGVWESSCWNEVLHDLVKRGLRRANLWIAPSSEECRKIIRQLFPEQPQSYCRVDLERELATVIEPEIAAQVARRIKEIYRQQNYEAAKKRLLALITDLEGVSVQGAALLAQNPEEYLNYFLMPRPHWFYLKSTHCVREAFVYLKRWTTQIYEPENLLLMLYAIASSLPHRFLKAEMEISTPLNKDGGMEDE
jgi:transposase-like protein